MAVLATYNFPDVYVNPTHLSYLSDNWTEDGVGNFIVSTASAAVGGNRADHSITAYYNAVAFPNDQYSKVLITVSPGVAGHDIGVAVRVQNGVGDAVNHCYAFTYDGANVYLYRLDGDSVYPNPPLIQTSVGTLSLGTELKVTAVGSLITGLIDGVDTLNFTDVSIGAYSSGSAGISGFGVSTVTLGSWEGGSIPGPQSIDTSTISSIGTVYSPTIVNEGEIIPAFITSTATVYNPTIDTIPLVVYTQDFNTTISLTVNTTISLQSSNEIVTPVINSIATINNPTVSLQDANTIVTPVINSTATINNPTIVLQSTNNVLIPLISSVAVIKNPTLQIVINELLIDLLTGTAIVYRPSIRVFSNIPSYLIPTYITRETETTTIIILT